MINLLKLNRVSTNEDVIVDLIKLYQYKGKDYHYADLFKKDYNAIVKKTVNTDLKFLTKSSTLTLLVIGSVDSSTFG